jgi:signal transduction histidine kinase
LDLVVRESDRLNRVLTEFLNFARMPKPQVAEFDVRKLLDEVAAQVEVSIPGSSAEVRIEGPRELLLWGDSEQLRQVFVNIGLNAVEATGGKGPVVFKMETVPGGVAVSASDRGTGIDEAIREKIFEPFFTTKTTGTGLGLSVARRIVEDHGGSIEAGGGEDGWTRVKVFLPAAGAKPEAEAWRSAVEATGGRMVY